MVKLGGMALLGTAAGACAPFWREEEEPYRGIYLPTVRASPDRVTRTMVGLRPFRPQGFRLEAESMGEKTVIHNYGHGGAGVSLCWGTARMAAEMALETEERRAAVLGAGAVGLATARELQRRGFLVTIYTKAVWPDPSVCSGVAPARFTPSYTVIESDQRTAEFDERYERAAELSYRRWAELVGRGYGAAWTYQYSPRDREPSRSGGPPYSDHGVEERLVLGPGDHPFDRPYALRQVVLSVDAPVFLQAILQDFLNWHGQLEIRSFPGPHALMTLTERLVVNCTGLGAREVAEDESLTPIRGQVTAVVPQAEVDYILTGGDVSMVPRSDGILLGGAPNDRGDWRIEPDEGAEREVLDSAGRLFESMRTPPEGTGRASVGSPTPVPAASGEGAGLSAGELTMDPEF